MLGSFNLNKMDMIYLTDEMCDYLDEKYSTLKEVTLRRRIYSRFNILRQIINSNFDGKDEIETSIIKYIKDYKKFILKNENFPMRDKIALISLLIGKNFFKLAWKIYETIKY